MRQDVAASVQHERPGPARVDFDRGKRNQQFLSTRFALLAVGREARAHSHSMLDGLGPPVYLCRVELIWADWFDSSEAWENAASRSSVVHPSPRYRRSIASTKPIFSTCGSDLSSTSCVFALSFVLVVEGRGDSGRVRSIFMCGRQHGCGGSLRTRVYSHYTEDT